MRRGWRLIVLLLFPVLSWAPLEGARAAPAVAVSGAEDAVTLLPRTELLDSDGAMTAAEAAQRLTAPDAAVITREFSRGFVEGALWALIVLDVAPDAAGRRYLSLELPNFDRLEVYSLSTEVSGPAPELLFVLGDRVPPVTDIRTKFHIAPLDLPAGRAALLVRGTTNSTMTLALRLWQLDPLLRSEQGFQALQMYYLGVASVLFLGAMGLFVFTRQPLYLVYMGALVAHCGLWLMANGAGPGYLWPDLAGRIPFELHALIVLSGAATFAFAAMFLSTDRVPRIVPLTLWAMTAVCLALAVLSVVVPDELKLWSNRLIDQAAFPMTTLMVVPLLVALRAGEPAVRPLLLTWAAFNTAVAVGIARNAGLLPSNLLTLTGPQLGSVVEMIIFAYMLVSRLGRVQREKEDLQREALAVSRAHEAELEQRVADRTAELDLAVERERDARRLQQQFVAMVSHEFRTPLSVVDAAAQNFASEDRGDRGRLEKILGAVRNLRRMIDNCLIDDRVQGGAIVLQSEEVDLSETIEDVVEMLQGAFDSHRFRLTMPDTPVVAMADPRLVAVAISNVLENAAKYSPPGSEVGVVVARSGGAVEVAVTDQGAGVPEADRERIFDRFYRGDAGGKTGGAGLGLFLVRSILEAHGGTVECGAGSGGGARFTLRLPAGGAPAERPA